MTRYALITASVIACAFSAYSCGDDDSDNGSPNTGGTSGTTGGQGNQAGAGGEGGSGPTTQKVTLQFRAKVGDEPFACGETYAAQGSADTEVTPQDFRFYVSDVRLISKGGDEIPFVIDTRPGFQAQDVALLDFEDGTEGCKNGNPQLNDIVTGTVPPGEYEGVVFSLSVPEELNHENPATLPDPLQAGGMTWGWLYGYKFIRAELAATTPPGAGVFHLGSIGCDNTPEGQGGAGGEGGAPGPNNGAPPTTTCSQPNRTEIRLTSFDAPNDVIVADIGAMMAGVDLSTEAMCHGMGAACGPLMATVGLDEMGGPLTTQSAFRSEAK